MSDLATPMARWMGTIEEQNRILRNMLAVLVELLPKHTDACGVHRAHPNYGDYYCDCQMKTIRAQAHEITRGDHG